MLKSPRKSTIGRRLPCVKCSECFVLFDVTHLALAKHKEMVAVISYFVLAICSSILPHFSPSGSWSAANYETIIRAIRTHGEIKI